MCFNSPATAYSWRWRRTSNGLRAGRPLRSGVARTGLGRWAGRPRPVRSQVESLSCGHPGLFGFRSTLLLLIAG
jgi:hypothetical protein